MALDKLVDSTQLDADLTSVANAIRTKGGTSASLAFPADFVSAIAAIPSGGGSFDSGTFTPATSGKTQSISVSIQPTRFAIGALNEDFATDNSWKCAVMVFPEIGKDGWIVNKYGSSNYNGNRTAPANCSYSNGAVTVVGNYNFISGMTYQWVAW